jgi:hypothetical protein
MEKEGKLAERDTIFKTREQHPNRGKGTTRTGPYSMDSE